MLSKFVADDILKLNMFIFKEKTTWHFTWIHMICQALFSLKKKNKMKNIKLSSAIVVIST